MLTLLPSEDFLASAATLDKRRLINQRTQCLALLRLVLLSGHTSPGVTANDPSVLMWEHWNNALVLYGLAVCVEANARGIGDSMNAISNIASYVNHSRTYEMPPWLGVPELHASHRALLLSRSPDYYSKFNWSEAPSTRLWWPESSLLTGGDS